MSTTLVKHRSALALLTLCLVFTVSVALLVCPHQACAADPTLPINLALTPSGTLPLPDGTTEGSTVAFDYDASTKTLMLKMRNVGTPGDIPDYNWQVFPFGGLDDNYKPTTDIRKIILDEGIRKVGRDTFHNLETLQSITIPSTLEEMGTVNNAAFVGCIIIGQGFSAPSGNPSFSIDNGSLYYQNGTQKELVRFVPADEVPASYRTLDETTKIRTRAFEYLRLNTITLAGSGLEVADSALMVNYSNLVIEEGVKTLLGVNRGPESSTILNLPASLEYINSMSCMDGNLKEINVDPANSHYESIDGVLYTKTLPRTLVRFPSQKQAQSFVIPAGVTAVGNQAFIRPFGVASITFPKEVTSLGFSCVDGVYPLSVLTEIKILNPRCVIGAYFLGTCNREGVDPVKVYGYKGSTAAALPLGEGCVFVALPDPPSSKTIVGLTPMLSRTTLTYNGRSQRPAVSIAGLREGIDFTVSGGRRSIGTGTVTITGKGVYTGSITRSFKIVPKRVSQLTPRAGSRRFTARWSKVAGSVKYQVAYRIKGSSKYRYARTSLTSKTITRLKARKYYYIKVRAYKTVSGINYYGSFSTLKRVKTR